MNTMNYRRLGRSGLKVSELSFGSWVTYGNQLDVDVARECMAAAYDAGVNFFDNAEVYAKRRVRADHGRGARSARLAAARPMSCRPSSSGASHDGPNEQNTLNRKYLMQAIDGSLARLQLDCVDLVLLPPPRPRHADRGNRAGDADIISRRQGALLGHVGVDGRRRSVRPGTSPSATTCTSR